VRIAHGAREFELEDLVERRGDGFGVEFHGIPVFTGFRQDTPVAGGQAAAAVRASMLSRPAPNAITSSRPSTITRFFRKWMNWFWSAKLL
jgi:hypothetical protein